MKYILHTPNDNKPASVQIVVWHQADDSSSAELIMASLDDVGTRHSSNKLSRLQNRYLVANENVNFRMGYVNRAISMSRILTGAGWFTASHATF